MATMSRKVQVLFDNENRNNRPGTTPELPSYAWPGGYDIIYVDSENACLCADCANKELTDGSLSTADKIVDYFIYEEDMLWCDQCNRQYHETEDYDENGNYIG